MASLHVRLLPFVNGNVKWHTKEKVPTVQKKEDHLKKVSVDMAKRGLYANIHAKRLRIKKGSGEKMRKPGAKGAPTAANFKRAAKTAKR